MEDAMSPEDRLRPHPRERLAAAVGRIDLAEETARLRAEPHPGTRGHRQLALVRRGPVSLILFVFDAGGLLTEHRTEGEVTIHALAGRLAVDTGGGVLEIGPGEIVSLAPGETHSVRAVEESEMLLTVCRTPAEQQPPTA